MQGWHPKVATLTYLVHAEIFTMSDLPIQPQLNQPEKIVMKDLLSPGASIFSSIISSGCQVWISKINQETQLKLADKNREKELKLADKNGEIQIKLERLKNELREASDLKQFERQKELQLELADFNRETQLKIAAQHRETTLALPEVNKLFDHWPLRIVPSLILNSPISNNRPPLKVIIAPPEINFDKFGSATQVPKMENNLAQGLRQFLDKNYSHHSPIRPVEFLDGAWDSNKYHGGSSIKVLFGMLKSEPLLILESEIEGDYLNFRVAYWGYGDTQYKYATALARLPYTNILYDSAKSRAIKWKPDRDRLIQMGENPKSINEWDTHNLELLEKEAQFKDAGIDISKLPRRYRLNSEDFDAFYEFLITVHALFAGLTIDIHYLIHYDVTPLLPELLSELVVGDKQVIGTIISNYQGVYQSLDNDRSAWIPELFLDLANSLINLPDKSWAREQLNSSVRYWLSLRGATTYSNDLLDLIEATDSFLTLQDKDYLEKLKQCLVRLGDTQGIQKVNNLWLNTKVLIVTLPGEIKLELVKIPTGNFMMGSNEYDSQKPIHKVTLKEFNLGKYPVTQEQYQAVMGNNPSHFKDNPKNPVECVGWEEAQEFCQKLKQITGKDFRLPTEAEWEYACRAGTQTRYYENQLGEYAWCEGNSDSKTHPVGQKKPNNWGLYDMSGNTWEWCEDCWHDSYANKPENIKNNGNAIWSSSDKSRHVLRGGSWKSNSKHCRLACRHWSDLDDWGNDLGGFRIAIGPF